MEMLLVLAHQGRLILAVAVAVEVVERPAEQAAQVSSSSRSINKRSHER
jgi:hypothetical protein